MFDIITARDFLAKLEADYADFKEQPDSARLALNCIITAYHLHEWVWGDWLKTDYVIWQKLGIRDKDSFKKWIAANWSGFETAEALTNGIKHFRVQPPVTDRIVGYGSGPYGVGPCGKPYLLVDYGEDANAQRWQTAEQLLEGAVFFWQGFFRDNRQKPASPSAPTSPKFDGTDPA
jgi:hypothetical protein